LVETLALIAPDSTTYAVDVLSLVEAILEHPRPVLYAQERRVRDELFAKLKAEGVEYDERQAELEKATYPKPNAEFIYDTFNEYARKHPWLDADNIRPKSVVRDMFESYASFSEYVKRYGLAPAEGVLLRYLSDAYKTLVQSVPAGFYTDELTDIVSYLRATLQRVDTTLVQEWEQMLAAPSGEPREADEPVPYDVAHDPKALRARIRADLHLLVKALSDRDYAEAMSLVRAADEPWTEERFERVFERFYAEHERLVFDQTARYVDKTQIEEIASHVYKARQILVDEAGDNDWYVEAEVDVREGMPVDQPLLRLKTIAS
jgi:hypothetical protein